MSLAFAANAFRYVPILFATSPVYVVRSVPTITRSTSLRCIKWPAALSAIIVCGVDRRSRGAVINKCEPTCIAVSKHIDRLVALRFGDLPNERQAVLPDNPAMLRILICDQIGCAQCQGDLFIHSFSRGDIL